MEILKMIYESLKTFALIALLIVGCVIAVCLLMLAVEVVGEHGLYLLVMIVVMLVFFIVKQQRR